MEPEILRRQLRDMAAHGVRSVCPHPWPPEFRPQKQPSFMTPEYLSEAYFKSYKVILDECGKLGMNCFLYDEGGWPSGSACGRVMAAGPDAWAPMYWTSGGIRIDRGHPEISAPVPNLLVKEATEKFLELTHEAYFRHFASRFGKTFRFAFTDEPRIPASWQPEQLPWCPGLPAQFRKHCGYALEPWLPALLADTAPAEVKIDFHDLLSKLFVKNFLLPVRSWCRRHRLLSGGHFGGENEPERAVLHGHGHIMRSLRTLDLPGVDAIWRQVFPGQVNSQFPKFASSIAHQAGRKQALAEIFAVYGNGLTPAQRQFLVDYMLVRGVNTLVFSKIALTDKRQFMLGCRPHFGAVDPLWKYSKPFHEYIARAAWLLTRGSPVIPHALYFDMRSLWAGGNFRDEAVSRREKISSRLMQTQCDFDFVDDDALEKAEVKDGKLRVGRMRYSSLIMPESCFVPEKVKKAISSFKKHDTEPLLTVSPPAPMLRVCKRKWGRRMIYFCVNEGSEPLDVTLTLKESPILYLDLNDLSEYRLPAPAFQWHFAAHGSAFFLTGKAGRKALKSFVPLDTLPDAWLLRPLRRHIAGREDFEILDCHDPAVPAVPGDWSAVLGSGFSGDAVYSCKFETHEKSLWIDLGQVCYCAEVRFNGKCLGKGFRAPFIFDLSPALKRGSNHLEVTVSNTLANALAAPGVLERLTADFPPCSPYEKQQRAFEADSLTSGLFGPVRIGKMRNRS